MRRRFMNSKSFDENNYLTFVCLEDNSTIMFTKEIYYSINGSVWNKLYLNTPLKVTVGMHISFKENFREIDTVYGIGYFITEGKFNILGNVNSLIFGDNAKNQTDISSYESVFTNLFIRNTSIIDASLLKLPATTLANYCYNSMFRDCTSLTTAPELPATTLADYCYSHMFSGCTSLTTAPELPATTLADYCYSHMFDDCTSLTTAPELPATTLTNDCYYSMFDGCTSLTTAPELPATTLADSCYNQMFYNCTNLIAAPSILPATTLADYCYCHMFSGCTSLTTAPELPATTLANYCYNSMFRDCTSLTTAPELPATTLAPYCYIQMFDDCTKLNYIKMLATDISASNCLYNWVYGVVSTGTFVKNPAMTSLPTGSNGIPSGWTVVNDGEESGGNLITFTIEGTEYQAEEGMTWFDWCNDTYYSKGKWVVEGNLVYNKEHTMSIRAYAYDTIVSGQNYMLAAVGSGGVI